MTDGTLLTILALCGLLALDLATFAARTGYLQTTHARLLALREQAGNSINRALALHAALPRVRATLNLTLVLTRFSLAGLAIWFTLLRPTLYPFLTAILGLLVCALLTFWLEWAIERVVLRSPESWSIRSSAFVRLLVLIFLLVPLTSASDNPANGETPATVTEDEVKTLVDAGEEEGVFQGGEKRMIYSIFELGNTIAREIMIPRIDMQALDVHTPLLEAIDALLGAGHSRVPVYEDTVDNTLGLLYAKDLLRAGRQGEKFTDLRALLRPAYFVPESKKLDGLLAEMQTKRIHMAIVVDEYGGVAGLVTLEDIVEEFLGEIRDEYDIAEEAPYQKLADGSYVFLGRIAMDDFNEIMHGDLSTEEADTLGGYIYSQLGHVPNVGETVRAGNLLLTVEQVSARRIRKVSARWIEPKTIAKEEERVDG